MAKADPQPEEQDAEAVEAQDEAEVDESAEELPAFTWQASEFLHQQKGISWYLAAGTVAAILIGVSALTKQWFSIPVFVVMAAALMVYAGKKPRVLNYTLSDQGLEIEGKHYNYSQFRDFAVISDVGWHTIELDPAQRFMPRLSVLFDDKDFDAIVEILSAHLPRTDRSPDIIETFMRKAKF